MMLIPQEEMKVPLFHLRGGGERVQLGKRRTMRCLAMPGTGKLVDEFMTMGR